MNENDHQNKKPDKELESARLEIEALKRKLQYKDQLLSTIFSNFSHEIRTPMNGIIGFSELLHLNKEISCEEVISYAGIIEESSLLLMAILNDTLDIARIEAGKYKIYPETFDLSDLLFEIFMEYKSQADRKKLQFLLDNMISEQFIVESAPGALKKVLVKLIDNAIKFTKEGWIKVGYLNEGEHIVFYVEDTGIGISDVIRENLFDSFTNQEVSKSRKVSGTGLDLTLCKGLVNLLGGEIQYVPKSTPGSLFRFSILNYKY